MTTEETPPRAPAAHLRRDASQTLWIQALCLDVISTWLGRAVDGFDYVKLGKSSHELMKVATVFVAAAVGRAHRDDAADTVTGIVLDRLGLLDASTPEDTLWAKNLAKRIRRDAARFDPKYLATEAWFGSIVAEADEALQREYAEWCKYQDQMHAKACVAAVASLADGVPQGCRRVANEALAHGLALQLKRDALRKQVPLERVADTLQAIASAYSMALPASERREKTNAFVVLYGSALALPAPQVDRIYAAAVGAKQDKIFEDKGTPHLFEQSAIPAVQKTALDYASRNADRRFVYPKYQQEPTP